MTYGHVVLPELRQAVDWGCCLAPAEAWPMLGDLAKQVAGPSRALFVLAHPGSTSNFDEDTRWPGTGLGREYALLAANGQLDGFEVVSYSNDPFERWNDWYDALSSGLALTPTAGTDAVLNRFASRPAGGWRMYAEQPAGATLQYNNWIEAVRAGKTFVTTLPLVPRFRIGVTAPGSTLEAAADTSALQVSFEVQCVTGLTRVSLIGDRGVLWTLDLSKRSPRPNRLDTTFTLRTATPGWIALKTEGVAGDRSLLGLPAIAHTNAVRLLEVGAAATPCDRVRYRVTLAADSTFADPTVFCTDSTWIQSTPTRAGLPSWWRIEAIDRGGNVMVCEPARFQATLLVSTPDVGDTPAVARPRLWPNPARGSVRLEGLGPDVVIVDVAGRRVASPGRGLRAEGTHWVWDTRTAGRAVRPGLYFVLSRSRGVSLPVTIHLSSRGRSGHLRTTRAEPRGPARVDAKPEAAQLTPTAFRSGATGTPSVGAATTPASSQV